MEFTPLTGAQRQQFDEQGFLVVPGALDQPLIDRLVAASDQLIASDLQENRQVTKDGLYDGFRNVIALDDAFLPLLTFSATVPLIVQLLSPRIHLVTSHLIYKHPDLPGTPPSRRDPGWHRDIQYTPQDLGHAKIPRMEIKCAYYLSDLSEPQKGATLFSPGSNNLKHNLEIPADRVDPDNVFEPLLKPGDAVLFENRTFHAGGVNLSSETRKVVMFGYGYQWLKPFDYFFQPPEVWENLDNIGKQFLGALKDEKGRFVSGGINKPLTEWYEANKPAPALV
jgi:ectoine hydroxylase-related dioxygenase (phytanoyl-CoA dioxygenase family)